jgi:hypothetical protein
MFTQDVEAMETLTIGAKYNHKTMFLSHNGDVPIIDHSREILQTKGGVPFVPVKTNTTGARICILGECLNINKGVLEVSPEASTNTQFDIKYIASDFAYVIEESTHGALMAYPDYTVAFHQHVNSCYDSAGAIHPEEIDSAAGNVKYS